MKDEKKEFQNNKIPSSILSRMTGSGKTAEVLNKMTTTEQEINSENKISITLETERKIYSTDKKLIETLYKEVAIEIEKRNKEMGINSTNGIELTENISIISLGTEEPVQTTFKIEKIVENEVVQNMNGTQKEATVLEETSKIKTEKVVLNEVNQEPSSIVSERVTSNEVDSTSINIKNNSENLKQRTTVNSATRTMAEKRMKLAQEAADKNAKSVVLDNLPFAKEIAKNNNLLSVPTDYLPYLADILFKKVLDNTNFILTAAEENFLFSVLNARYRTAKVPVNVAFDVPENFNVDINIYGINKTLQVNSYTGYVNGTTETIEEYYKTLSNLFTEEEANLTEMDVVIKRHANDELSKKFVVSYVEHRLTEFNLSAESRNFYLFIFKEKLKEFDLPVLTRIEHAKKMQILAMYDSIRIEQLELENQNRISGIVVQEIENQKIENERKLSEQINIKLEDDIYKKRR
ncbi:MAG: hypothetical protein R3Y13_04435 [bacterium]